MGKNETYTHVIKNISLDIMRGEFIAIVGQSGSGKSTLMNLLGCLDRPTSGSYFVSGIDTSTLSPSEIAKLRSKTFGFVFQRYNLLCQYTALENVALPAIYRGMPSHERKRRALSLLQQFELASKAKCKPNQLSGGQQQRVSIARALMNGGETLLADEPTGALDTHSGNTVMSNLKMLNSLGHTIILITHNLDIARHAHRLIEIQDGEIISDRKTVQQNKSTALHIPSTRTKDIEKLDLFIESSKMAIQSIFSHKLRSALTMLGIVIGIAAVVSVIALGRGSQDKILSDIHALGTNTIEIFPGKGFGDMQASKIKTLTANDAEALAGKKYVDGATPRIDSSGVVIHDNIVINSLVYGVGSQFFRVKNIRISSGRSISSDDVDNICSVAIIDEKMGKALFSNNETPIGATITINKRPFKIIGIATYSPSQSRDEPNPSIFIPYSTLTYKVTGKKEVTSIIIKVKSNYNTQVSEKDITSFLTNRHNKNQDFFTFNTDNVKIIAEKTTKTMTLLISSVAFISLLVGGIGVMNIMLVSVTERTSEIGIRMAVGARHIDILTQFIIESMIVCILGGLFGILGSFLLKPLLDFILSGIPLIYSVDSFILAAACSSFIGLVFGFVPAKNASNLSPIEALGQKAI